MGLITVAASCRVPTQVTVSITTGEKCSDMSAVQTVVSPDFHTTQQRFTDRYTTAASGECNPATGFVGTLVITPGGSRGSILVAAGVRVGNQPPPDAASCADVETAKRCIIARRAFGFLDGSSRTLPIHLDPLCVGRSCDVDSTCFKGSCVSAEVICNGDVCGLTEERPGEGDGGGTEAGSSDGAYDADVEGGPFDDASRDGGDGSVIADGSPDADGSVDPNALPCGNSGIVYCHAPSGAGRATPGQCNGTPNNNIVCCRCICGSTSSLVQCEATASMGSMGMPATMVSSCHPTCAP